MPVEVIPNVGLPSMNESVPRRSPSLRKLDSIVGYLTMRAISHPRLDPNYSDALDIVLETRRRKEQEFCEWRRK